MTPLYLIEPERLGEIVPDHPRYRADQLRDWLYRRPVLDPAEMTDLPKDLRRRLVLYPFRVERQQVGDGGATVKWLFRTDDAKDIEAVLMGYPGRATLCLSSQAGCALGCTFCATGQFGFERQLDAGEMVAQVAYAQAYLRSVGVHGASDHLTNIVFMGMGEPLANYRNLREALRRIIEVMGFSARAITVSTVGIVPGIRRLAGEPWPIRLAVSLHAADDELRSRLVPINRRYPLEELVAAADEYARAKRRRLSIEWTLIDGVNDTDDQADRLARIALRLRAHVNLIPLNPTPLSQDRPSPPDRVEEFARRVRSRGVEVTVRDIRGADIDAACGQLRVRSKLPAGRPDH
ncbi:MAG: putative dual-specificity RNA methyltransferase RlmN [Acidimicrobiia bacterium]|nr:MAG: putative dual-specificity RNA methyltransferase RlmN [Acidimicrobiia bacterium]